LDDAKQFPIAAKAHFGNVRSNPDLVTSKLAALHFYQLAIPAPKPPAGSFNAQEAERGKAVFEGKAKCATCHVPMHTANEIGIDDFQASRSPDKRYRTTPLRGLFVRMKGGFYHDGRFPDLAAVVGHYNKHLKLNLTAQEKSSLVEYLKSL
jgi:cytochrome c peroxidase